MRSKIKRPKLKGNFPAGMLFLAGFFLGSLIPNLMWKDTWQREVLASFYLLQSFSEEKLPGKEYFIEVLRVRGSWFLLNALCGLSIFGVPLAVLGTLLLGAQIGGLFTISILQFGLAGGIISLSLLLPQYLLYIPSEICFLSLEYHQSFDVWKNHGLNFVKMKNYGKGILLASVVYFIGILLEGWCNPWIVKKILGFFTLF